MEKVKDYIESRIAELDKLILAEQPGNNHYYALMAGKFELLLLMMSINLDSDEDC